MLLISSVPNKLHPPHHLSHGEEAQDFRSNHTRRNHLLPVQVPYAAQYTFWRIGGSCIDAFVEHARRITDNVHDRLCVFLESSQVTVGKYQSEKHNPG